MSSKLDYTHDLKAQSWVTSANSPETDFPIQNLPYGIFRRAKSSERPRVGVAIGNSILDLAGCVEARLLLCEAADACVADSLNHLMALGTERRLQLRREIFSLLSDENGLRDEALLVKQPEAELFLPARVGNYTDFYASIFHATNVGSMFRPDNPLLPNYKYVPIGYHGRASSLVISGSSVRRPSGQTNDGNAAPTFGPSKRLDYELELGMFVSRGNELGVPIPIADANNQRGIFKPGSISHSGLFLRRILRRRSLRGS
jgi:fumarylacetoacetase